LKQKHRYSITWSTWPNARDFAERDSWNIGSGLPCQSGLMLAARITLPHFSVFTAAQAESFDPSGERPER
jgi:hypothetical protein